MIKQPSPVQQDEFAPERIELIKQDTLEVRSNKSVADSFRSFKFPRSNSGSKKGSVKEPATAEMAETKPPDINSQRSSQNKQKSVRSHGSDKKLNEIVNQNMKKEAVEKSKFQSNVPDLAEEASLGSG